jgi:hypothetical protein
MTSHIVIISHEAFGANYDDNDKMNDFVYHQGKSYAKIAHAVQYSTQIFPPDITGNSSIS